MTYDSMEIPEIRGLDFGTARSIVSKKTQLIFARFANFTDFIKSICVDKNISELNQILKPNDKGSVSLITELKEEIKSQHYDAFFINSIISVVEKVNNSENEELKSFFIVCLKSNLVLFGHLDNFNLANFAFCVLYKIIEKDTKYFNLYESLSFEEIYKESYLILLGLFLNQIGTKEFLGYNKHKPNSIKRQEKFNTIIENINFTLKFLKIDLNNSDEVVQRVATNDGLFKFMPKIDVSKITNLKIESFKSFDSSKYRNVFISGKKNANENEIAMNDDDFLYKCLFEVVKSTENTSLNLLYQLINNKELFNEAKTFPGMPNHSYEYMVNHKLGMVANSLNDEKKIFFFSGDFHLQISSYDQPKDIKYLTKFKDFYFNTKSNAFFYNYDLSNENDISQIASAFHYDIVDGFNPLEFHILRLLLLTALNELLKKDRDQINIAVDLKEQIKFEKMIINVLLFPETPYEVSRDSSSLLIYKILNEIRHCLVKKNKLQMNHDIRSFRISFSFLMNEIIPSVYEERYHIAAQSQDRKVMCYENVRTPVFNQPSWKKFLIPFLTNQQNRENCKFIYHYLRLQSNFEKVNMIPQICNGLYYIWGQRKMIFDNPDILLEEVFFNGGNNEQKEYKRFIKNWIIIVKEILLGLLTEQARNLLKESIIDGSRARLFLPYELENWPVLIVLNYLSKSHNEFVEIIQNQCGQVARSLNDYEIFLVDGYSPACVMEADFSRFLLYNINVSLGDDGIPLKFITTFEDSMANKFKEIKYSYIVHPILNCGGYVSAIRDSENLISKFETYFRPINLSQKQKHQLYLNIVKNRHYHSEVKFFIERIIFITICLMKDDQAPIRMKLLKEYISEYLMKNDLIKDDDLGCKGFLNATSNVSDEDFKVCQCSKIFQFLDSYNDLEKLKKSNGDRIMKSVMEKLYIKKNDLILNSTEFEDNFYSICSIIPKVFQYILNTNEGLLNNEELEVKDIMAEWNKADQKPLCSLYEREIIDKILNSKIREPKELIELYFFAKDNIF